MGMIGNSLAQGLISGANIVDGTVDTPDIKDSAVTAAKIATGVVTPGKLSTGAPTWDSSGNVGVGAALSGWSGSASGGVVQLKNGGSLFANTTKDVYLNSNMYYDGTNNVYISSGYATQFSAQASTGAFQWYSAASGSANGVITFGNPKMTLSAGGDWFLGGTTNSGAITGRNLLINCPAGQANKITFNVNGGSEGFIYHSATELSFGAPSGGATKFQISGSGTRALIDSNGRFCINSGNNSGVGLLTINNNSADGTSDYTQGIVFTDNSSGTGPWTHAAIWTVGSSGYNGSLLFGTDNSGANDTNGVTAKAQINPSGVFSAGDVPGYLNLGYFRFNYQVSQGTQLFCVSSYPAVNEDTIRLYASSGGGMSTAASAMQVAKNSTTGKSINAAGTINASGADYAEYMTKADDFVLAKGDVVGVNAEGKLTNVFADAVSFVVKSTDPSYVGGDTWFTEKQPVDDEMKPVNEGNIYDAWVARLEAARALVDRIAFAGQVPVNVTGAIPGQFIIPVNDNGGIAGQAVSNPTFEQYQIAVGKVIAIEEDGRARIIVKVA